MHATNRIATSLSIILSTVTLPLVAAAQPSVDPYPPAPTPVAVPAPAPQPPVATPAPQTTPWSEVEHINGQLVKVGEKTEYLKANKKYMIGANPAGWLVGMYGVSGWLTLHNNVALKGDFTLYDLIDDGGEGLELSVSTPLYLKRVYQGFFIEPGLMHRTIDSYEETGIQLLMGWQRTWDSGFSVVAAAGPVRLFGTQEDEWGDDESISFNGYFRIGYGF